MKSTKSKWRSVLMPLFLFVLLFTVTACGGQNKSGEKAAGTEGKKTVIVWASGSDNVRVQFDEQIKTFNAAQDKYEAKLEFITSGTGAQSLMDKILAAKKAGKANTDFDVVEMGGEEINNYLKEGGKDLFVPLDDKQLTNKSELQFEAPTNTDKFIPYRGTTVVLAYNSEKVANPPKTAKELYDWIKANPGRFAYNTPDSGGAGGSFVVTSVYNFLDKEALNSTDSEMEKQWDKGFALLKDLHSSLYQSSGKVVYPNKNQGALDLLSSGEIDMTPMWADMLLSGKKKGTVPASIQMAQIDPAFTGNVVVLGIPSMSQNKEGAHAFLNYMISAQAQNIALDSMAAIPVIDFAKLDPKLLEAIKGLQIKEFRASNIGSDLSKALNDRWTREISVLSK